MQRSIKKLTLLSAASAAALPASAAIVYTDLGEGVSTNSAGSVYFSLSEQWAGMTIPVGGTEQFSLSFSQGSSAKPQISNVSPNRTVRTGNYVARFAEDDLISSAFNPASPDPSFDDGQIYFNEFGFNSNWASGTRAFIGLRIGELDSYNYAWAEVEYATDQSLRLYGFAYENSGAAIAAGAIPEPDTALMAALAAGSVALFGRRRKAAASAHA